MALFDSELQEEIFMLAKLAGVVHYTHFHNLFGSGKQGRKEGSVTWPGTNEILMMIMTEEQWENLKEVVKRYKEDKEGESALLLFQWKLNEVVF
jgi:hypothetical protein